MAAKLPGRNARTDCVPDSGLYGPCRRKRVSAVKEEALKLIEGLPEEASWEDVIYQFYVRKKIERGIEAADANRIVAHDEVKKQFLR